MVSDKQRRNRRCGIVAHGENNGAGGEKSAIDEHCAKYGRCGLSAIGKVPSLNLSKGLSRDGQVG